MDSNTHKVQFDFNIATNQLMAYAGSLKGQSSFLVENVGNREKI